MAGKAELVVILAQKARVSKVVAGEIIDLLFTTISNITKTNEPVTIKGFGKFEVVTRVARAGRNPKTGDAVAIPEKQKLKFSASKNL